MSVDIFQPLGAEDADEMRVILDLSRRIALEIEDRNLSQSTVVEMAGFSTPDIDRIANGPALQP